MTRRRLSVREAMYGEKKTSVGKEGMQQAKNSTVL